MRRSAGTKHTASVAADVFICYAKSRVHTYRYIIEQRCAVTNRLVSSTTFLSYFPWGVSERIVYDVVTLQTWRKFQFDEYVAGGFLILYTCSRHNFFVRSILDNTVKRKQGLRPMSIREKFTSPPPRAPRSPRFMVAHSEFKERRLKGGECLWKLIPRQMPLKAARFIYSVPFCRELYAQNFSVASPLF